MKKIIRITAIVLSVAALFACKKEDEQKEPEGKKISGEYSVNIDSPIELAPGTELSVIYAEAGTSQYGSNDVYTMPSVGSRATGTLSTPLVEDAKYDWYVVSPYSSAYESPEEIPFSLGTQTQSGKDSDEHLVHFLAGAKKGVTASTMSPKVTLKEMTATLAIKVYNTSSGVFNVNSIKVAANAPIAAGGSIDLTSGNPVFTPSGTASELTLNVTNASIDRNASATFYMMVAPCQASQLTITIGDVVMETECSALVAGETTLVDFSTAEIPHFIEGITASIDANNYWHANLVAPYTLSGEFDLKDIFSRLPSGNITFEVGTKARQNALVQERYDDIVASLNNGHWKPEVAFGTALNVDNPDMCGILFVMKQDGRPLFNIYISCVDPLASKIYMVEDKYHLSIPELFADNYSGWGGGRFECCEAEYWQTMSNWELTMLKPGAQEVVHLGEMFSDYTPCADPGNPESVPVTYIRWIYNEANWSSMLKWISNFADLSYKGSDGKEIFFYNGKDLELTDYGKALTRNSKGLYWMPAWTVMLSSARWNLPSTERGDETHNKEQADGTYWGNLDANPLPGVAQYYEGDTERLREERGIYIEDGVLKTDSNYTGIGFRLTPRLCFEYDYGTQIYFLGPRYIAHIYFNRYFAPATASDR